MTHEERRSIGCEPVACGAGAVAVETKEIPMDTTERFVYVGRKPCGCAVGIVTDLGDDSTANAVAEFIRDGLTVNRVDWSVYRQIAAEKTFMACPHGQLALPLDEE